MEEKKLQQETGFDSPDISEKNREALQSETWQKAREAMKAEVDAPAETVEVTTAEESSDVATTDQTETEPEAEQTEAPTEDFKKKACEKLQGEKEKAKNKQFAEPVIGYLLKRCEEDNGLAQDVMQKHKTWEKCFDYIYDQARKQAKGERSAAVRDDVVYEWAEDYYHKDDKAEEEKKAKEAAERKKKAEENKKKAAEKKATEKDKSKEAEKKKEADKPAEAPKPKKNPKEMDGQMNLFSMMGM